MARFDFLSGIFTNQGDARNYLAATESAGDINPEALENPIAMADRYFKDSLWELSNAFLTKKRREEAKSPGRTRVGGGQIPPISYEKAGLMNIKPFVDPYKLGGYE
jgi:hypothetical protein